MLGVASWGWIQRGTSPVLPGSLVTRTWRWYSNERDRKLLLVAFSGKRRAGKDTGCDLVMDAIQTAHIPPWKSKQSIGYFPKRMYCEQTGANLTKVLRDDHYKEEHRQGIIETASAGREIDPLIWIKLCYQKIMEDFDESDAYRGICFVPDIRFKNEMEYLLGKSQENDHPHFQLQSFIIRIHSTDEARAQRGWVPNPQIDNHASEMELDETNPEHFEYQFLNTSNDMFMYRIALQPLVDRLMPFVRGGDIEQ